MHNRPTPTTPTFSIITVTYNAGAVLEDTIQSVIAQTYHHVEYIIVDGASKDNTLAIVARYRNRIARVVSEPDRGLYDAMNKGIALATGDYLCFLNAGDSFHEDDTLQQIVHSLAPQDTLPGVIYGDTDLVDAEGHFVRKRRLSPPEVLTWKSFRQGMLVCHQAFFARRDLVEPYDLHLVVIDYLDEGLTTANRRASLLERFRIMARHYGWLSTVAHHAWFVLRLVLKK